MFAVTLHLFLVCIHFNYKSNEQSQACPHHLAALDPVPSAWGTLVGLVPETKLQEPLLEIQKHYKSLEFLSIFRMSSPSAQK